MSDTHRHDQSRTQASDRPPFYVILAYLLGAWTELRVLNVDRATTGRDTRR